MPLTTDDLEILRRELSELPTTRPRTVTKQRAIAELAPELAAAQRRGYTVDDLAQLLADRGLAMTPGTLRGYLRRNRRKRRGVGRPQAEAKQPAQSAATSGVLDAMPTSNAPGGTRQSAAAPVSGTRRTEGNGNANAGGAK